MPRWIPRLSWSSQMMSDGRDLSDDAEGWKIEFEWFGRILQLGYLRRGALRLGADSQRDTPESLREEQLAALERRLFGGEPRVGEFDA